MSRSGSSSGYNSTPLPSFQEVENRWSPKMKEFEFREVQLLKEDLCGTGSYGRVCKAMVDQLVCAAKVIHPTFFSEVLPSTTKTFRQFQQECDFLSVIRHPCIVQYLGTTQDVESGLPVLLMELMDESLTKFLERKLANGETVPYHTQVNLCHDVCMALAFLHSNGIIHRDLSSNNILLVAENRAKVTDFGMSKLVENNPRMTPLTQCPGCLVYMAPEALRTPPTYTEKLDVFSMGVCIIQIITLKFPNPGDAKRTMEDARHGTIEVPIPERERRRSDISEIQQDNPLLGTALDCLADSEGNRPSSKDLCHRMLYYRSCQNYSQSEEDVNSRRIYLSNLEQSVGQKDQLIGDLRIEVDLVGKDAASSQERFETVVVKKDYEIRRLKAEVEQLQGELMELLQQQQQQQQQQHPRNMLDVTCSLSPCRRRSQVSSPTSSLEREFERMAVSDSLEFHKMEEQLRLEAPPSSLWYHGPLSRVVACQRLEAVNSPGAYLMRESCSEQGAMVLSFLDGEMHIHHFRIVRNSQRQFNIGGNIWFSSLTKLVGFHTKYSSVVEKHSERLDHPVEPPVPVPLPMYVL